ncbi:C40 family peptidase [Clostridium gasigenes]|uniref:C40 family peptidase n=1 Tax=Clostridium gasigenes TaxID=94869 RepID=UPI001C0AE5DE|nr:C40 family peptidase [Clostridium gasigenes]MBU3131607.1 C40 family peptidase [Clostridium gasigenes]
MKFKLKKVLVSLLVVSALIPYTTSFAAPTYSGNKYTNVWYTAHVQDIGWMTNVSNGDVGGTTGQAKQLEALQIAVQPDAPYSITYEAYVKTLGWTGVKKDAQTVGTVGKGLPLTAISIAIKDKTTGQNPTDYDVYYRVHVSNIGWEAWTTNGSIAGNQNGNNIEAIQIEIRAKGSAPSNKGEAIVAEAYKHIGKPYVWGATGPSSFDCSGFTQYVYKQVLGIDITRITTTQVNVGTSVAKSNLQKGDLVFFDNTYDGANPTHVGIYVGNGTFIHCGDNGVGYSNLNSGYWLEHYARARRVE